MPILIIVVKIYSSLQKFLNKMKTFLINHKKYVGLKLPFQTIWIEIRPHETWGLIFDPYCLIIRKLDCWKLFVLHRMTWILRISRFCQCYKLSKNFWRALYVALMQLGRWKGKAYWVLRNRWYTRKLILCITCHGNSCEMRDWHVWQKCFVN